MMRLNRTGADMDVSAIFELPVHIWVTCDALAAKYPTGYGELRFSVVLPTDQPPLGGAPDVPGTASRAELTATKLCGRRNMARSFRSRFGRRPRFIAWP